jgi:hypothetical protein
MNEWMTEQNRTLKSGKAKGDDDDDGGVDAYVLVKSKS